MTEYSQAIRGDMDGVVRHYEYDDCNLLVADFGPVEGNVDIVDGTAMVVVGADQFEFEVSDDVGRAVMNNGVVTIETER